MAQTLEHSIEHTFSITGEALHEISRAFAKVVLNKGDYFQKKGKACSRMAFMQTGLIRVYDEYNGKEVTQWITEPGYFLTDIAAFSFQVPARWNMQALADCELYVIQSEKYNSLTNDFPEWNRANRLFLSKCFATMEDRIYSFISLTAEERYQKFFSEHKDLFLQVPLQYIASMLGMTPETFSRIRNKLSK